uniref:Uncharacterized protein n=1 Tax=Physcomitrium patens TaxID=3218 RepID=A0A7I3ZVC0_PHYPA
MRSNSCHYSVEEIGIKSRVEHASCIPGGHWWYWRCRDSGDLFLQRESIRRGQVGRYCYREED